MQKGHEQVNCLQNLHSDSKTVCNLSFYSHELNTLILTILLTKIYKYALQSNRVTLIPPFTPVYHQSIIRIQF